MDWDDEDVRAILTLVDAAGFDELEIETDRFTLSLRRGEDAGAWTRETLSLGESRTLGLVASAPSAVPGLGGVTAPEAASLVVAVHSPLPGTFYRSPKPGAPPFVEVGTRVTRDSVVAIVETMKLMNSVYAGVNGRVAAILVPDGSPVAQNAVLLQVEPDGRLEGS